MDIEAQKRAAAARAVEFVRPGMRLGLGTGSTAQHFVELVGRAGARRPRRHRGAHLGGDRSDAERLGVPLTTPRRDAGTRSHRRRRRRDRARPEPDQGRWRRAVAGKDRRLGLGPHDRHRRRSEMGVGARPLSAAGRGGAVRAWPRPGARSRRRRPPPDAPARRCCGGPGMAMLSSRTAGTGSSMPRSSGSPIRSRWPVASRHPRRGRARLVHRARAHGRHRRLGRRAGRRAAVSRYHLNRRISMISHSTRQAALRRHARARPRASPSAARPLDAQQPSPTAIATAKELIAVKGAARMLRSWFRASSSRPRTSCCRPIRCSGKDLNEVAAKLRAEYAPVAREVVNESPSSTPRASPSRSSRTCSPSTRRRSARS